AAVAALPAVEHGGEPARSLGQPVGARRDLPDLPRPVLYVAAPRVFPHRAEGDRGVRDARRLQPAPDAGEDPAARRGTGRYLRRPLRVHAVLERVPLRTGL